MALEFILEAKCLNSRGLLAGYSIPGPITISGTINHTILACPTGLSSTPSLGTISRENISAINVPATCLARSNCHEKQTYRNR